VLAAASALVVTAWVAPSHAARTPAEPTIGLLESGTSAYVHGAWVWTDYAYDDHGANRTATYPEPRHQGNAADLVQLQLGLRGKALAITAVLETLTHKEIPVLTVGLDLDGNARTGAASLPGWKAKGALGLDRMIVVSSTGASVSRWDGPGWRGERHTPASVDPATNTMRAEIPGLPLGKTVRVVAQTSVSSGFTPYDLAFVRGEAPKVGSQLTEGTQVAATGEGHATGGEWQDRLQGEVLAGTRDARTAVATVDLDALRHKRTRLPDPMAPGYHTWLYRSQVSLPEGIVDGTAAGGLWAGPYQPYLVQVPAKPDGSAVLYLHGGGANHLGNGVFAPQGDLRLKGSIGVFPYGRTITTANDHGYHDVEELDVLDALGDAIRHNRIDASRVVITGVSTGSAGAARLAMLHPDLFSGLLVISGYDDTHLPENLLNVNVVLHNGGADPAASQGTLALTTTELDQLGDIDYRSYSVAAHDHGDPTGVLTQCVLDRLTATRIPTTPGRVVLGLDPRTDAAGLDLRHGQAYWVRSAHVRPGTPASVWHTPVGDPPAYGDNVAGRVDLTTDMVARRTRTASLIEAAGESVTEGRDFCGPNASAHTNDVWRVHGLAQVPGAAQPTSNTLTGSLSNISDLTVDLARAGLTTARPLRLVLDGDGPLTITLRGSWRHPVRVLRDGSLLTTLRSRAGALTLKLDAAGHHTFEVR
jgi:predicted esterase